MKGARIRSSLGSALAFGAFVLYVASFVAVGHAQTGRLKGKVVDADNKPVEGAVIEMESKEMNRKLTTKTDRRGEYTQFLPPGPYTVTARKGDLFQTQETKVSIDERELNFTLKPGGGAAGNMSAEDRKKAEAANAALQATFSSGITLINEGKYDDAIAKLNEVIVKIPKCKECYTALGQAQMGKKDYDQAEAAFKKAIEVDPASGEAYMGLATVYNAQKKFDQANEASQQAQKLMGSAGAAGGAAGGGNASASFNQGVIAWNAGKYQDAQKFFSEAVTLNPKMAEAQYRLGMAHVNLGNLPDAVKAFEEYLKLEPSGQFAGDAKQMIAAFKK